MEIDKQLIANLPDAEAARRFAEEFGARQPGASAKLARSPALLSDVLTLAAFSPLLSATILQHPDHVAWLGKRRVDSGIRSTGELIESLAQFDMTHAQLPPQVLYPRFRRRELMRIFLRDIRRLATVPEITEEISNLADAILSGGLELATNEMNNRFGRPQCTDSNGRLVEARFCVVALGKLGSRELNYSSDIDLIFLYSDDGETSGNGSRGKVTNREYFVKLTEHLVKLVGTEAGEGAAYRVDLRLRPHGRLGPLAMSVSDTARYYETEARTWERQVMIRSRGCAGDAALYRTFFSQIEGLVFAKDESPASALESVRRSKELIDKEQMSSRGYNVKLGRGGIREIEFIAQALQLAHGGKDAWLRFPHTLVSLSRLADRGFITEKELTGLSSAYDLLRRTEHILQMENGLQTHTLPLDESRRRSIAKRVEFAGGGNFEADLRRYTDLVSRTFRRVFGDISGLERRGDNAPRLANRREKKTANVLASISKTDALFDTSSEAGRVLERVAGVSRHFAEMLSAYPDLVVDLREPDGVPSPSYAEDMLGAVRECSGFGERLAELRRSWSRSLIQIVVADVFGTISLADVKRLQTELAEASVAAAMWSIHQELTHRYRTPLAASENGSNADAFPGLAVLALGKLGGRGVDYDSDLDLVFVYDAAKASQDIDADQTTFSRAVELFVTALSSMTRHGSLYRVDLRLRPYGSKGLAATSISAFMGYMRETAAPWEFLAFVKLRAVGGDLGLARSIETQTRSVIHERARQLPAGELAAATRRVRTALEESRTKGIRHGEIDIKYGAGGMLDIYFATRYLQLRDDVPDDEEHRSTGSIIGLLRSRGSLDDETARELNEGYEFLALLDHSVRLTVGRTTRLPTGDQSAMRTIAERMSLGSHTELLQQLTLHRLALREIFEKLTS